MGGGDALDDRAGDSDGFRLVELRQEHGELVAAQPEALAALAEARRDLPEHAVTERMAVAVVDALEVVDVDEAEAERIAGALRRRERTLQALVEVTVVSEPGERVGERKLHGLERGERRSLVERDREQRADERD